MRPLIPYNPLIILAAMVLAAGLVSSVHAESTWIDPNPLDPPPEGGAITAPLNTSGIAQTLNGTLTINNTLDITGGPEHDLGLTTNGIYNVASSLSVGNATDTKKICLNPASVGDPDDSACRSDLYQDISGYLHLQSSPDASENGYIWLEALSPSPVYISVEAGDADLAGLTGYAGQAADQPTYGLYSIAGTNPGSSTPLSVGLYGAAGANDTRSVGIGGTVLRSGLPVSNRAYAGYFKGRVAITDCLRFNGGECKSSWSIGVDPTGSYVRLLQTGDPAQDGNVGLTGSSASAFANLVLGDDPSGLDISVTCGDGMCNNGETSATCAVDCSALGKVEATGIVDGNATINWQTTAPSSTIVRYGLTGQLGAEVSQAGTSTDHTIGLTALNQNTVYYYQVISVTESGSVFRSSIQTFQTLLDQTPPAAPTNLRTTTPSPEKIPIVWYHTLQDAPGGSGFSRFRIYRDDLLINETGESWYEDVVVDQDATYTYRVTALDARDNESGASNAITVHVPTACTKVTDCRNPSYSQCCGALGCNASCPGGSPVVLKLPSGYQAPDEWQEGGGLF